MDRAGEWATEEARVVVFPELSLTGYELDLAPELALSETDGWRATSIMLEG